MRYNVGPGVWEAIKKPYGAQAYVTKYATKPHQKEVPEQYQNCGRFWGCSKGVKPEPIDYYHSSEKELRHLLWLANHPLAEAEFLPKYLWNVK